MLKYITETKIEEDIRIKTTLDKIIIKIELETITEGSKIEIETKLLVKTQATHQDKEEGKYNKITTQMPQHVMGATKWDIFVHIAQISATTHNIPTMGIKIITIPTLGSTITRGSITITTHHNTTPITQIITFRETRVGPAKANRLWPNKTRKLAQT